MDCPMCEQGIPCLLQTTKAYIDDQSVPYVVVVSREKSDSDPPDRDDTNHEDDGERELDELGIPYI